MRKYLLVLFVGLLWACQEDPSPKPFSYYRIDLKDVAYKLYSEDCPFEFKISNAAKLTKSQKSKNPCYKNLVYPDLNATFYLSYLPVKGDLKELIDQEYAMREKHNSFSSGVKEHVFHYDNDVNVMLFEVKGTRAATPYQFFITDSTSRFFRGSLYFYNTPNNDSLAPVIRHLRKDLDTLFQSFKWK